MRQKIAATILLCCLYLFGDAQILVKPGGSGNGKTWQDAIGLEGALLQANSGAEIWLMVGTYTPVQCSPCTEADREKSFVIPEGVKLLGGFSGIETIKEQRNWKQNPTILSGDIDGDGTPANNSYSVIFTENVSSYTVADGLIIRDGNADGDDIILEASSRSGGGWYNGGLGTEKSSPVIRNCIFEFNRAAGFGGAMYNMGAFDGICEPMYENCIFRNNQVQFDGGALYNNGSFGGTANYTMMNCVFENNFAGWEIGGGGGLFNNGIRGVCNPIITNCTFSRQQGSLHGGAIYNQGKEGDASPLITNCVFYKNEAIQGAGIFNLGAFPGSNSSPIVTNCTFYENTAYDFGGAVVANGDVNGNSRPEFRNCIFWGNAGGKEGNIFYKNNGQVKLEYCLVDEPDCQSLHSAFSGLSEVICGDGILYNKMPKFLDAPNGNLRIKFNSSAIDMGQDSFNMLFFDLDLRERIALERIDIGAYEYNGHPPTRMESFSAETNDDFVKIEWVSSSEFQNSGFEIQRSRDSINWEAASRVSSYGDALHRQSYAAFDVPPKRGEIYYYRLKQIDSDNCAHIFGSDTAFIRPNEILVKLFPTPTDREITLKIYYPRDTNENSLRLFVSNSIGQIFIKEEETNPRKGWTTVSYDLSDYSIPSGIHYFYVFANGEEFVLPFALIRF